MKRLSFLWENHLVRSVYIPTLILAFAQGMLIPILPLYVKSFDVSYGLVGLALGGMGIGTLIGDLPTGVIMGRIGRKRSMMVGIGVLGLSILAVSWAHSVLELLIYLIVGGMGSALWNISRHAYITDSTPVYRRGRAIAIFGGVNRIGSFIGPAAGGYLTARLGVQAPFVVYAGLAGVALIFPLLFVQRLHEPVSTHRGGLRGHTGHLLQLLRGNWRILAPAGIAQIFAQTIRSGRNAVIPLYGADILHLDEIGIGWIVSLASGIDMVLFPLAGWIMDHWGRKYAYVPCFFLQGVGMALIPFTGGFSSLLGASMLIGFGNGLGSGTMMTLGADLAPKESMGEFLGIWRLIGDVGQTSGPAITGVVADLMGLAPATFVIAGIGWAAAAIFGLFVPETLRREVVASEPTSR